MEDDVVGEIRMFAGDYAPPNWRICNGDVLPISGNEELFSALGFAWGGDGVRTFGLPNLQGCVPIGQGMGPGLTSRTLGETGGTDTVLANLPHHTHTFSASSTAATLYSPGMNVPGTVTPNGTVQGLYTQTLGTPLKLSAAALSEAGGGELHENRMPTIYLTCIICVRGTFLQGEAGMADELSDQS